MDFEKICNSWLSLNVEWMRIGVLDKMVKYLHCEWINMAKFEV